MTDYRTLFIRRSWVALASLSLVMAVACAGGESTDSEGGIEGDSGEPTLMSDRTLLPNPNPEVIVQWAALPDGRTWGSTAGIDIGPDGHVWTYDRCGANGLDGG